MDIGQPVERSPDLLLLLLGCPRGLWMIPQREGLSTGMETVRIHRSESEQCHHQFYQLHGNELGLRSYVSLRYISSMVAFPFFQGNHFVLFIRYVGYFVFFKLSGTRLTRHSALQKIQNLNSYLRIICGDGVFEDSVDSSF